MMGHTIEKPALSYDRIKWGIVYFSVIVLFVLYSSILIGLPGLYMDSINPEYMISEILYAENPIFDKWLMPGNVLGGRFPIFSGPVYHGNLQVYATLPFLSLVGVSTESFRVFQIIVMSLVIMLAMVIVKRLGTQTPTSYIPALTVGLLIATDPITAFGIRTQAYSVIFPLPLLLGSWILLEFSSNLSIDRLLRKRLFIFLSGVMISLAIFSYFVYAFFVPVLLSIFLRKEVAGVKKTRRNTIIDIGIWLFGGLVGFVPFVLGIALLVAKLGGIPATMQWWQSISSGLKILGSSQSVFDRINAVLVQFYYVVSGKWLFLMVLGRYSVYDYFGILKTILIVLVLILGLWAKMQKSSRLLIIAIFTYLCIAMIFGQRLSGHHLTLLIPLIYIGIITVFLPKMMQVEKVNNSTDSSSLRIKKTSYLGIGVCVVIIGINVLFGIRFLEMLRITGGVGLFSDSINRFSNMILAQHPNSIVYFPDWGFRMPFTFLTKGVVEYDGRIDPVAIMRNSCLGRESYVVLGGSDNDSRFELIEGIAGIRADVSTWSQLDGKPVFEAGYFPPNTNCETTANDNGNNQINVTPSAYYSCNFFETSSPAYVTWDFSDAGVDQISIYIGTEQEMTFWMTAEATGSQYTGAWPIGGKTFVFADSNDSEKILDEFTVGRAPCPIAEFEEDGSWQKPHQ